MGGFQKAFSLLFPKHRRFDIEDLSTGLLQRVAEAGENITCEKFIAMYLEAQAAGLSGTQRWILFSLKKGQPSAKGKEKVFQPSIFYGASC